MNFFSSLKSVGVLIAVASSAIICSCKQQEQQEMKFNKRQWDIMGDIEYPYRNRMINDLTKNHKLVGLTYKQLTDLLGSPHDYGNKDDTVRYDVIVDWGWGFSTTPIGGKLLNLSLNSDSTIRSYKVLEWKRE